MKSISRISAILCLSSASLMAQDAAAVGPGAASPNAPTSAAPSAVAPPSNPSTSANPPPAAGLLTPPPDNAPVLAAPSVAAPTITPPGTTVTKSTTTTTTSSSTHMTRQEIARVQQQEIIRRQELNFQASQAMDKGHRAELAEDYPVARQNYLSAVQVYFSTSRNSLAYTKAAQGLERVDFKLYDSALQAGDTGRAKMLADEVVTYNPTDKDALAKQTTTDEAIADPNDTSLLGNRAITPGFVKRVNEVQQLFDEAEQFRRTGQYDEAEARLKRILGIDAYNIAAAQQLEKITAEKNEYEDHARYETRTERLRQVEEKWYQPISNKSVETTAQDAQPAIVRATNFDLDQRLRSIFVTLNFNNATIESATTFLTQESRRLDEPDHKGINFIIRPDASSSAQPITITLTNVPLGEALRYICQLANVKYKVQDYAISIVPFSQSTDDLTVRTFIVQPSFVATTTAVSTESVAGAFGARRPIAAADPVAPDPSISADPVQAALEAKGIKFPPGASAVYNAANGTPTVTNTADQMEFIEELVNAGQAPTLMVRIAAKFVEINQTDLNDLTINTGINIFGSGSEGATLIGTTLNAAGIPIKTPIYQSALPGSLAFGADSIDALVSPQATGTSNLALRGILGGVQFNAFVQALSRKRSFDLLSEPAALTKSGEQATLEAVRVFPYPIAFDPPELVTNTNQQGGGGIILIAPNPPTVIPTTPTDFKRRNVGVRLVIKPQVVADNKTVDLSLFPEVTDFDGFINYGSPILVGNPDGTESLLAANPINQPVFNTRRINTKVLIRDGSTVVLGGLIREDLQTVDDRVPFLGDLPLLGRLFQSKATQSTKRNLIIFVSANIYRNDGELLNPPEVVNAVQVLTGHATP